MSDENVTFSEKPVKTICLISRRDGPCPGVEAYLDFYLPPPNGAVLRLNLPNCGPREYAVAPNKVRRLLDALQQLLPPLPLNPCPLPPRRKT